MGNGAYIKRLYQHIAATDAFCDCKCLHSINACRPEAQKTYQVVKQELPCAEASFSEPRLHFAAAQQPT